MPEVINEEPGRNPYKDGVRKFGRAEISSAGEAIVWDGANGYDGWLATEEAVSIVSDNVADAAGGLGCQYLQFTGQGNDGVEKTYSVTLTGTTPVLLSTTDPGVLFNIIYTAQCVNIEGTNLNPLASGGAANIGTITISSVTTGKTMAIIMPNLGRTQMMIYRVPSDHFGLFYGIDIYPATGKPFIGKLMARDSLTSSWLCVGQIDSETAIPDIEHPFPDYLSPGTDLCLIVTTTANNTNVSAQMWIEKKPLFIGAQDE